MSLGLALKFSAAPLLKGVGAYPMRGEDGSLPSLDYDFVGGRYYRSGALRTTGTEFTTSAGTPTFEAGGMQADAGDRLSAPAMFPLINTAEGTLLVELSKEATTAGTCAVSLGASSGGTGRRVEITTNTGDRGLTFTLGNGATFYVSNPAGTNGQKAGRGIMAYKVGEKVRYNANGDQVTSGAAVFADLGIPMERAGVGFRTQFNDISLEGLVKRVIYWPKAFSATWMLARSLDTTKSNLHLHGDSFVNQTNLRLLRDQFIDDPYRVFTFDGVGGSTLTEQAARFALTPSVWNRTLLIMDGGLDTDGATSIAAIADMVGRLSHSRWLYVEPSPAENWAGSPARATYDAAVATIRAYVGESRFVETLTPAKAASSGDANDIADVANNIWPRSLRSDSIHPTTAGWTVAIGVPLRAKLIANGWG